MQIPDNVVPVNGYKYWYECTVRTIDLCSNTKKYKQRSGSIRAYNDLQALDRVTEKSIEKWNGTITRMNVRRVLPNGELGEIVATTTSGEGAINTKPLIPATSAPKKDVPAKIIYGHPMENQKSNYPTFKF